MTDDIDILEDRSINQYERHQAAYRLGAPPHTWSERSVDALITALRDPNTHVRQAAAWSLGYSKVETKRVVAALANAAQHDPNPDVRRRAEESIKGVRAREERYARRYGTKPPEPPR